MNAQNSTEKFFCAVSFSHIFLCVIKREHNIFSCDSLANKPSWIFPPIPNDKFNLLALACLSRLKVLRGVRFDRRLHYCRYESKFGCVVGCSGSFNSFLIRSENKSVTARFEFAGLEKQNVNKGKQSESKIKIEMSQVIKYVGRTTDFKGHTLWDIVNNLKNFGVGRVVGKRISGKIRSFWLKLIKF